MEATGQTRCLALEGLTNPRALGLAHIPIRTRENGFTHAAWRLTATCDEGEGTITLVEISPDRSLYRGEGVFLGWPQERLESAYAALLPKPEEPGVELQQMG